MTRQAPDVPGALPPGTRLLHIGPHKTGTTSVQGAFHLARRRAEAQGVHYAGPERHAVVAVQAAIDPRGATPAGLRRWRRLLAEVDRSRAPRIVVSSEWFADAEPEAIRRIVHEVGKDRARVAITIRSLQRVLPSQWQQYVAAGLETAYEPWLRSVLEAPDAPITPTFWRRHRHDELVARWVAAVGSNAVTVIVVDDRDHDLVLRAFERLTGLQPGTLVADHDRTNRSLTLPEAEVVRAFNRLLNPEVLASHVRLNLGLYGATAALRARAPLPGEERIETPGWALERALEIGGDIVEGIRGTGVQVIGDLESLQAPIVDGPNPSAPTSLSDIPGETWLDVASAAAMGVLTTSGLARARRHRVGRQRTAELLRPVSTGRLARVVVHRVRGVGATRRRNGVHDVGIEAHAQRRTPTNLETEMVRSFEAAVVADGLPRALAERVVREGVLPEMLRLPPPASDAPWREVAALVAFGVVRAAGLLRSRPNRRRPAPMAAVETLEVGRVSTPGLAMVVARRLVARGTRRGREGA